MRYRPFGAMNLGGKNASGRAVKVDVAMVAKGLSGLRADRQQFFNDRDEEIGSLATLSSIRGKHFAILQIGGFSVWVGASSQFLTIA